MNYYLVSEENGERHLVVAADEQQLNEVLKGDSSFRLKDYYELKADTFDQPGFLMSEKD